MAGQAPNSTIDGQLAQRRAAVAPGFDLPVLHRGELGPLAERLRGPPVDGQLSLTELRAAPVVLDFLGLVV